VFSLRKKDLNLIWIPA